MKTRSELNQELRQRILALPGVTERPKAGIHEDAFFVGKTMFMHIHGHGHCDIRLAKEDQERALAKGQARPHCWAPRSRLRRFYGERGRRFGTRNGADSNVARSFWPHSKPTSID